MKGLEETAVSFAVEECSFVSIWQRVSRTCSFSLYGGFLKSQDEGRILLPNIGTCLSKYMTSEAFAISEFYERHFQFYKTLLPPDWKEKILSAFEIVGFFFNHLFLTVPSFQCPRSSVSVIESINQSGNNPAPLLISSQSKL